jgi:hypothetical protein
MQVKGTACSCLEIQEFDTIYLNHPDSWECQQATCDMCANINAEKLVPYSFSGYTTSRSDKRYGGILSMPLSKPLSALYPKEYHMLKKSGWSESSGSISGDVSGNDMAAAMSRATVAGIGYKAGEQENEHNKDKSSPHLPAVVTSMEERPPRGGLTPY